MIALDAARSVAEQYLAGCLPRRWSHVCGVAKKAETIQPHLATGDVLTAACWLHDVGYSPEVGATQFHPLDGARALERWGASPVVCGLVAFHSAAKYEAEVLGLFEELSTFTEPAGVERDLLWYLDMTTDPDGETVSFSERMAEVRERYPAHHHVIRALDVSMADRRGAVDRAQAWLSDAGLDNHV